MFSIQIINNQYNMSSHNTNIFFHAPKELTTDAFLVWLLYFLDSDVVYEAAKQDFFDAVILKKVDKGRAVSKISLKRQENNVDVLLTFVFNDDKTEQVVLFENKTWSSYHGTQLSNYKEYYPQCYRYIYYKLAYINTEEERTVTEHGYEIVTAKLIALAIKKYISLHPLIKMYYEYITQSFIKPNETFYDKLFNKKDYSILWGADAQKFLCDLIVWKMEEQHCHYLEIKNGTSFGRPWTQIDIAENEFGNKGYWEKLVWRVDIRSGKFYIRLNLYSDPNETQKMIKMKHRDSLRNKINSFPEISVLKSGDVNDRGIKESEIVIFFLEDNDLNKLINTLPAISTKIVKYFNRMK